MQFDVTSPVDGRCIAQVKYTQAKQLAVMMEQARASQRDWACVSLSTRQACARRFVDAMVTQQETIGRDICRQMGRPLQQAKHEVLGVQERAEYLIDIAPKALADIPVEASNHQHCFMRKHALGLILVIAPWNYPLLTAVNVIVPAILAGNAVFLKHSSQTPFCALHFHRAWQQAGLPEGLFHPIFLSHQQTARLMESDFIDFVSFTGSVKGGRRIQQSLSQRFIDVSLELGGKDAAYVRADADLNQAAQALCEGSFFNAGQSCCGIERIYVERSVYPQLLDLLVAKTHELRLGDPMLAGTTLGPMAKKEFAERVRRQVDQAVAAGANPLIEDTHFNATQLGLAYCAPQILVDVDHSMAFMQEEVFGPAVGVMPVDSDEQAMNLINDSKYGLTASVWTQDKERAIVLGNDAQVGTWFMNRCDYLNPALAWTGMKATGKGLSLSLLGFDALTRIQSFNLRMK